MDIKEAKIVFLGTPEFSLPALNKLIDNGYNIVGVITRTDQPVGRKQILTSPPIKQLAEKNNLPVFQFKKFDAEAIAQIKELQPDLMVLVAYGKILPAEFLNIPKFGVLNIHPSLLPKYRGPSPIQSAILNGETKTGISIIKLDAEMDHGPIVAQQEFEIIDDDDYQSLGSALACEGAELLVSTLPAYLAGEIQPTEQDHSAATYTKILSKEDGEIDWKKTPIEIYCQIRAFYPWPGAWTDNTGKRVKILKAHIDPNAELIIDQVQPEGKEPMRYQDYLNGNEPLN